MTPAHAGVTRRCASLFAATVCLVLLSVPRSTAPQSLSDVVAATRSAEAGDGLLGSVEISSSNLQGLQQWNRVLGAMRSESRAFAACAADAGSCGSASLRKWRSMIVAASGLSRRQQIKAVNDFFNGWPYKVDLEVYGVREYWATPREFMTKSGDCEDYAIAKFFALRQLGFSNEDLRIVALRDRIRGIGHAVLSIRIDGDFLILDNLSNLILSHTRYKHYVPQVSMNETTRWAHVGSFDEHQPSVFRTPTIRPRN